MPHVHAFDVSLNDGGSPDPIVAEAAKVHLELLDGHSWWLAIEKDDRRQVLWFNGVE
jgi:hypothetical protein